MSRQAHAHFAAPRCSPLLSVFRLCRRIIFVSLCLQHVYHFDYVSLPMTIQVSIKSYRVGCLVAIDTGYAIYGDRMCCNYDVLDAGQTPKNR